MRPRAPSREARGRPGSQNAGCSPAGAGADPAATRCPPALLPSVLRAHPVLELATEDGSVSVEMDPEDEWRVRQIIEEDGMRCAAGGRASVAGVLEGGAACCCVAAGCCAPCPHTLPPLPYAASCRTVGW